MTTDHIHAITAHDVGIHTKNDDGTAKTLTVWCSVCGAICFVPAKAKRWPENGEKWQLPMRVTLDTQK